MWILEYFVVHLSCVYIYFEVYMFGWLYYIELPIVLLYLLRCLVYHMLSKTRRNSRSLHRVIAYIYTEVCSAGYAELTVVLLYLLRCLVYHMLFKTRRNSGSLHKVIEYICCIYFDAWCITCCSKREETLEAYTE